MLRPLPIHGTLWLPNDDESGICRKILLVSPESDAAVPSTVLVFLIKSLIMQRTSSCSDKLIGSLR